MPRRRKQLELSYHACTGCLKGVSYPGECRVQDAEHTVEYEDRQD